MIHQTIRETENTSHEESDREIWDKISLGDSTAFSALFKKYYVQLYQFAGRFVNDAQSAENIVQDLFAKLWIQKKNIQIKSSLKSYLYISIKNCSLNYRNQEKFWISIEKIEPYQKDIFDSPENSYIESEMHRAVHNAIKQLPEKCRQVYLMKRYENLQYTEIAEILNISVNTVKTQMQRAMKSLQKQLTALMTSLI
jgi:RNA polymerase sigma-70 factor (ECF subfamily)